jgi:hypothetical protein
MEASRMCRILAATVLGAAAIAFAEQPSEMEPASAPMQSPEFKSHVGYRTWTGTFVPVVDARLFVGRGQGGCQPSLQSEIKVKIQPDGGFAHDARPTVVSSRWREFKPPAEKAEAHCSETTEWPCYRLRAAGCRDLTLRFDRGELSGDPVEMNCPERRGPHPVRAKSTLIKETNRGIIKWPKRRPAGYETVD